MFVAVYKLYTIHIALLVSYLTIDEDYK